MIRKEEITVPYNRIVIQMVKKFPLPWDPNIFYCIARTYLFFVLGYMQSRDSSGGIAAGYWLDD
jgi:hypothetical protein